MVGRDRRNDMVLVQYVNSRGAFQEINLMGRVKTIPPLYLFGAFYYNLLAGTWVQSVFGAEYQAQCWSAGFFFEDTNRSPDRTQKKELKFNFYFNLLNIGSVGRKPSFMTL
jgi:lipopolysaccharide assembly outer membrane protein LptD (OstA)